PGGQPPLFDEATLSAKIDRYLAPGFEIRSAVHYLARLSKDLVVRLRFPLVQQLSIFSLAYYPCQRWGAYRSRLKIL
ncbi:MAG: hypothetical protein LC799_21355, partial [Actinobacteria bacterium]|nr:hypothetical protein [Actinomycetota bacterium]